jgi:hypothetical protein
MSCLSWAGKIGVMFLLLAGIIQYSQMGILQRPSLSLAKERAVERSDDRVSPRRQI